jgi:asparagine N-glycosylation enzyme membrane subunit Stt3
VASALERSWRAQLLILGAITLLGGVLRFYHLGEWSLWIDEIYTIDRATTHVNIPTIVSQWWHPSISVILTGITMDLYGVSEYTARLASAIIGVITIPILFLITRRLFGVYAGLLAAGFLAVSTWHIEASQTARYFTSMTLLYLLALFVFHLAAEGGRWWHVVAFYVLLVLALGERFVAASIGPVVVTYVLMTVALRYSRPDSPRASRNLRAMLIPGILVVVADAVRLAMTGRSFFLSWAALTYDRPISNPLSMGVMIARDIGVPLVVLGVSAGVWLVLERNRRGLLVFIYAIVPSLLVLLLNPLTFTKDRFAFATLPAWMILAAVGVCVLAERTSGRARLLAIGLVAALAAGAMSDNVAYYRVNNGNRLDWRRAFETVNDRAGPADEVVAWWPEFGRYYTPAPITPWAQVDSTTVVESGRSYWFVLDSETINGNWPMRLWVEREAELIAVYYLLTGRSDYLRVYRYEAAEEVCPAGRPGCDDDAIGRTDESSAIRASALNQAVDGFREAPPEVEVARTVIMPRIAVGVVVGARNESGVYVTRNEGGLRLAHRRAVIPDAPIVIPPRIGDPPDHDGYLAHTDC